MMDERKSLHDQVEQVRVEDIDYLADLINRFLHPPEQPESEGITFDLMPTESEEIIFDPMPPEWITAAEMEEQRKQALDQLWAGQSEMITRSIGRSAITRLGMDPDKIGGQHCGWTSSGGKSPNFSGSWFEGGIFNRLGMFHLNEQQIVTFERSHIRETERELIYKVRVLTPTGDSEKAFSVSI